MVDTKKASEEATKAILAIIREKVNGDNYFITEFSKRCKKIVEDAIIKNDLEKDNTNE